MIEQVASDKLSLFTHDTKVKHTNTTIYKDNYTGRKYIQKKLNGWLRCRD
jgi:hypothetical protein